MAEIGRKLWIFRHKMSIQEGRKLTLKTFADTFGIGTVRRAQGYEKGTFEIPGRLFFEIWKEGYSVDAIFAELEIVRIKSTPGDDTKEDDGPERPNRFRKTERAGKKRASSQD